QLKVPVLLSVAEPLTALRSVLLTSDMFPLLIKMVPLPSKASETVDVPASVIPFEPVNVAPEKTNPSLQMRLLIDADALLSVTVGLAAPRSIVTSSDEPGSDGFDDQFDAVVQLPLLSVFQDTLAARSVALLSDTAAANHRAARKRRLISRFPFHRDMLEP